MLINIPGYNHAFVYTLFLETRKRSSSHSLPSVRKLVHRWMFLSIPSTIRLVHWWLLENSGPWFMKLSSLFASTVTGAIWREQENHFEYAQDWSNHLVSLTGISSQLLLTSLFFSYWQDRPFQDDLHSQHPGTSYSHMLPRGRAWLLVFSGCKGSIMMDFEGAASV